MKPPRLPMMLTSPQAAEYFARKGYPVRGEVVAKVTIYTIRPKP